MELIEIIAKAKDAADEVRVHLITAPSEEGPTEHDKQVDFLNRISTGAAAGGITFEYLFDPSIHDRSIMTDTGWLILLGRGLDFYQYFANEPFNLATRAQEFRQVKSFGVTYLRDE